MSGPTEVAERRYLLLSVGGNAAIGCIGLGVSVVSGSQAILLDGLFNLTYMATGLFSLKVARLVQRGDDERFPAGYAYFEPLVNGIKGLLVLGVSLMALAGAIQSLLTGGSTIAAGIAVAYGIFATALCWTLAYVAHRGARQSGSPLVHVDAVNWVINAAISSCVLGAFIAIFLIRGTSLDGLVPYVDPTLVLIVVLITIGVPVRMAWSALMELLNRAPADEVVEKVRSIVDEGLADLPVQERWVRVVQPGRSRTVLVHVVLPKGHAVTLASLDEVRATMTARLQAAHLATILDVVFTADRRWGASLGQADARL